VALVDACSPAVGASGRGTGLLGPRLGPPVDVAQRRWGDEAARWLHQQSVLGVSAVWELASRYAPEAVTRCVGQLMVGFTTSERADVLRRAYAYSSLGLDVGLVVAGTQAAPAPWTEFALLFPSAAGVDPRALTIGLAGAAAELGVSVSDDSPVISLDPGTGGCTTVRTRRGRLTARAVVVTVDSATSSLLPPAGDQIGLEVCAQATAPLPPDLLAELGGASAAQVLSAGVLGAYRRITPDGRLVIGGGPVTVLPARRSGLQAVRRARTWEWQRTWLNGVHADLAGIELDHRWSGVITITRDGLPVLARADLRGEVWFAGGWNGHGLVATVMAGARLAESVLRDLRVPADDPGLLWRPPRRWAWAHPAARSMVQAYLDSLIPDPVPYVRSRRFLPRPRGQTDLTGATA